MFLGANAGPNAWKIYNEYLNGTAPNPEVQLSDAADVNSFKNNATTASALKSTLEQIEKNITKLPEVQQALNSFQTCGSQPYENQWDVSDLLWKLGLGGWQNVTEAPRRSNPRPTRWQLGNTKMADYRPRLQEE